MTLLVKGNGLAKRIDVGQTYAHENRRKYHDTELEWKGMPGWEGRQYALVTTGKRQKLMFERDAPK